jgi:hypothetical protein
MSRSARWAGLSRSNRAVSTAGGAAQHPSLCQPAQPSEPPRRASGRLGDSGACRAGRQFRGTRLPWAGGAAAAGPAEALMPGQISRRRSRGAMPVARDTDATDASATPAATPDHAAEGRPRLRRPAATCMRRAPRTVQRPSSGWLSVVNAMPNSESEASPSSPVGSCCQPDPEWSEGHRLRPILVIRTQHAGSQTQPDGCSCALSESPSSARRDFVTGTRMKEACHGHTFHMR